MINGLVIKKQYLQTLFEIQEWLGKLLISKSTFRKIYLHRSLAQFLSSYCHFFIEIGTIKKGVDRTIKIYLNNFTTWYEHHYFVSFKPTNMIHDATIDGHLVSKVDQYTAINDNDWPEVKVDEDVSNYNLIHPLDRFILPNAPAIWLDVSLHIPQQHVGVSLQLTNVTISSFALLRYIFKFSFYIYPFFIYVFIYFTYIDIINNHKYYILSNIRT